jgi:RHS repeat-associated protein
MSYSRSDSPARLLLSLIFLLGTLRAQTMSGTVNGETNTPIPGVGHDYIHLLSETVDPSSGSVNLHINIPTAESRGLTLPLAISYSSAGVFRMTSYFGGTGNVSLLPSSCPVTFADPSPRFTAPSCGWTYSYPQSRNNYTSNNVYGADGLLEYTKDTYTDFTFSDPSGVPHNLYAGYQCLHYTTDGDPIICTEHNNVGDTQVMATLTTVGDILDSYTVDDHDGTTYTFSAGTVLWPSEIEDRNGNTIYPTYTTSGSTSTLAFPDTAGRTGYSISGSGTGAYDTVQAAGLTYKVYWRTMAAPSYSVPAYSFYTLTDGVCHVAGAFSVTSTTTNYTMNVVSAIVLPNGLQYTFYYGDNNPNSALLNPYGLLSEIIYPNGAWVKYTYRLSDTYDLAGQFAGWTYSSNGGGEVPITNACGYLYSSPVVATRTVSYDGINTAQTQTFTSYSTTFSTAIDEEETWTSKVTNVSTTDAIRNLTYLKTYSYNPFSITPPPYTVDTVATQIPVESQVITDGWGSSTPLKTVAQTWLTQFSMTAQATTLGGKTSQTIYPNGSFLPTEIDDWDFGATAATRKTLITYQPISSPGIISVPCQTVKTDGSGNRLAETDNYFDGGTSLCATDAAGLATTGVSGLPTQTHDETLYGPSSTTPRGNLTQKVQWASTGTSPTTTYSYDETGQALSMTDPCGNPSGACTDMTGTNHTTTYSYSDSYTVLSSGSNTPYTSSANTNAYLTTISNPLGQNETFTYDYNNGQLTVSKDQNDINASRAGTTYIYNDPLSRPTQVNYPDGGQTEYSYNDTSPSVTACKNISGSASAACSATSPATGWKTSLSVMDGLGYVIETELVSDPDGTDFVNTAYDGEGSVYTRSNPHRTASSPTDGTTTYLYDAIGRTVQVTDADGSIATTAYDLTNASSTGLCITATDEAGVSRQSCYDGMGRMTGVWENPSGLNYETNYTYDLLNNLIAVTQNGSNSASARTRSSVYDSLSRLTSATNPESGTITYAYDPNSNLATRVAPKANQTGTAVTTHNYTYDVLSRLIKESHADPTEGTEIYAYDGTAPTECPVTSPPTLSSPTNLVGRRSAMCAELSGSAWSYDPMGRPLSEGTNNKGTSVQKYVVGNTYWLDGSLKSLAYPSGDVVTYTVGGAGRTTQVTDSADITFVAPPSGTAMYTPHGALAGMVNGNTSTFAGLVTSNIYNDRLQPLLLSASGPDVSTSITLATYPSGCAGGCIATYSVASSAGINVGDNVTVAGNSNTLLNGTFPVTAVGTGSVTVRFNDESSSGKGSGGTMTDDTSRLVFSLCYDFHLGVASGNYICGFLPNTSGDNGNVFQALNNVDSTRSAAYSFDALNRISQANTVNTTSSNCWGETYNIDSWGNLLSRSIPSGMSGSCITEGSLGATATTSNQLSGIGMVYDAAGNVTTDNLGNTPTYDQENRISTLTNVGYTYYYDADGARTEKTTGSAGTMYWLGPSGTLTETGLTGTINEEYIYFNGERIARVDRPSGAVHYYFSNHLGSHTVVTSATGVCEQDIDYYPYGGVITDHCPNVAQNYKFTGKERDTESGLDYFGARHYASGLGRFMIPDWKANPTTVPFANFDDPQSLNLYSYVRNTPTSLYDSDGHCWRWILNCATAQNSAQNQSQQVQVTQVKQTSTKNADGTTTVVTTSTSASLSTEKGMEGAFLGANQSTNTMVLPPDGTKGVVSDTDTYKGNISYGEAVQALGADALAAGREAALPSVASLTVQGMGQTVADHPVKVGAGALAVIGGAIGASISPLTGARIAAGGITMIVGASGLYCTAGGPGC